ncbi:hypothetical protein LO763_25605 [Glycomyces sp. A-F 0318]|uniref:hypothetical protein n=1 Tax=Glycomyces amatae TaxID=2881355 RepID=UPI001E64B05B|nr:hypothetical protein [Glycomyces amatae]MCD0446998.1 hypothetical protein [Glycomyces amatae]
MGSSMLEANVATAPHWETMTFRRLPEFVKQEAAADRLQPSPAKVYATACRRLLEYFPELTDTQVTVTEADRAAEALRRVDSDLSRDTLAQYAASIRKAAGYWFAATTGGAESASAPLVEHILQLRPDVAVRLALPHDLTAVEAAFLCQYLQRLALLQFPGPEFERGACPEVTSVRRKGHEP